MKKLGFHYFQDTKHYRQQDIQTWIPRLQALGTSWLTLVAPLTHAIPEAFLQGLKKAGIKPLLHFPLLFDQIPSKEDIRLLFKTYASRGVKHVILFEKPNTRSRWGTISWAKTNLVERFLDLYIPLAEEALKAGLVPVFPPLEQGGDYWDTTFLWTALEDIHRRGHSQLLDSLVLSVDANANGHPLNWGEGGPERWPEARPYFTPPGAQDQRGFRIVDWYSAISQSVLGKTIPIFMLHLGGDGDDKQRDKNIITLLNDKFLEGQEPLPPEVMAGMFWLLTTDAESEFLPQAWYKPKSKTHSIFEDLRQTTLGPEPKEKQEICLSHYLLLPTYDGNVTDWHLEVTRGFVKNHQPTIGFSLAEATHAQRVTVIGGESGFSDAELSKLRTQGCLVRRITGDGTEIAAKLAAL